MTSPAELALKNDDIKNDCDVNIIINSLFDQIDTAVEYVEAGGGFKPHNKLLLLRSNYYSRLDYFQTTAKFEHSN